MRDLSVKIISCDIPEVMTLESNRNISSILCLSRLKGFVLTKYGVAVLSIYT